MLVNIYKYSKLNEHLKISFQDIIFIHCILLAIYTYTNSESLK